VDTDFDVRLAHEPRKHCFICGSRGDLQPCADCRLERAMARIENLERFVEAIRTSHPIVLFHPGTNDVFGPEDYVEGCQYHGIECVTLNQIKELDSSNANITDKLNDAPYVTEPVDVVPVSSPRILRDTCMACGSAWDKCVARGMRSACCRGCDDSDSRTHDKVR